MATIETLRTVFESDVTGFQRGVGETKRGLADVTQKMESAGRKATLFLTTPILGAGVAAFKAASDLNESMSKVDVVFSENAQEIRKWAETAATSFGQSKQEALEAAGTLGNLFRSMEIGLPMATEMSTTMVQLAGDLASFNNASPDEALTALRSGLIGETEPLKRFGINLNAARIEEEALRMGLIKEKKDLTAAAKAQAAYSLIMKDSTLAQGDFARTSDGAANRSRILAARFKDTAASIGQQLLPMGTKLLGLLGGWLEKFNTLSPGAQKLIVILAGVAAAVGPVLIVAAKMIKAFGVVRQAFQALNLAFMTNPYVLLIAATILIVVLIIKNWETIKKVALAIWGFLKDWFGAWVEGVKLIFTTAWTTIQNVLSTIWNTIKSIASSVFGFLKSLFLNFTPVGQVIQHWNTIRNTIVGVWNSIKSAAQAAVRFVVDKFNWLKDKLMAPVRAIKGLISSLPFVAGSPIPMVVDTEFATDKVVKSFARMHRQLKNRGLDEIPIRTPSADRMTRSTLGREGRMTAEKHYHLHTGGADAQGQVLQGFRILQTLEGDR